MLGLKARPDVKRAKEERLPGMNSEIAKRRGFEYAGTMK
jgi:hypothetical protein